MAEPSCARSSSRVAASVCPDVRWTAPSTADAFCGFYVGGAGAELYNNATQVVMMREGTRTVLAMQNNYQGPTKNFAMVVPVPVVLAKGNVKVLNQAVFKRVDRLAAPRLVEYWERDPCTVLVQDSPDTTTMVTNSAVLPKRECPITITRRLSMAGSVTR